MYKLDASLPTSSGHVLEIWNFMTLAGHLSKLFTPTPEEMSVVA
jgi:hypothetical protein